MYWKLAIQNIRRSLRDYIIYFVTLTLTAALMYSFLALGFSSDVLAMAENMSMLTTGILLMSALVAFMSSFVIGYAIRFMLERRKKEFATYELIGMEAKTVRNLFLAENSIIGTGAFLLGSLVGTGLSGLLNQVVKNIFEVPHTYQVSFSLRAWAVTFLFFALMYGFGMLRAAKIIRHQKVIDLLYDNRKNEEYRFKSFRHSLLVVLLSIAAMVAGVILLGRMLQTQTNEAFLYLGGACLLILVGVYEMHRQIPLLLHRFAKQNLRHKYKEENLFFFGQLLSKLKSKTLSMTLICLTLTLSMALFFVTPLLVGWAQGFLEKRVPFDIQISSDYIGMQSGYIGIQSEKELPVTDYSFLDSFIEKNISVRDDCSFKTYFVNKTDFYNQLENSRKNAPPITAISLSDYNHLLKMAGYDEISLRDHEFTTQWLSITPQDAISTYLEAHKSIRTDGGDLQRADISAHTVDLGEDFYNFQSVIYIVPDHICNKLTSANTFRYMMADKTISYDIAQELKSYFENSSLTDSLVTYNITMRTIEVNDNSAIIFIMQTGLTYSAIILFVTCFTILALQQLSDSGKYKYRFRVLRNMGVEEPHIRKLILKQLAVWFGVPVILALILAGAFLVFLIVGFHMQIAVYIGVQRLVQQLLIVLAILGVLLISYFISTWVLFNKSASA